MRWVSIGSVGLGSSVANNERVTTGGEEMMKPVIVVGKARVFHGNCREVLRGLPDNSIDSVVTDPPYELGFMGKKWDSTGIAYDVSVWEECLRVLKPGGHVLAFGGSRTFHRMAVAIEDAGFEIRDSIAWMYGSGFPKSLNISKAIDKRGGAGSLLTVEIGEALRAARESRGISKAKADKSFCDGTTNWTWFEGRPGGQRAPTPKTFARVVEAWPELARLAGKVAEAEREVLGMGAAHCAQLEKVGVCDGHFDNGTLTVRHQLATAPSTPEAQQWQGWGTALKPAHEPIVVGRKPFAKGSTVAANVLAWGVGGLNIDASRIGTNDNLNGGAYSDSDMKRNPEHVGGYGFAVKPGEYQQPKGRWPANVILDEYSAGLLDKQSGTSKSPPVGSVTNTKPRHSGSMVGGFAHEAPRGNGYGDTGGASRFFYCAKASKRDRNEGLEGLEEKGKVYNGQSAEAAGRGEGSVEDKFSTKPSQNFHPTVKPTTLMRYLIKLVTPAGGTVLDPFTGSGSTGKAALLDGFEFVGVELTEEYLPIIEGRLRWAIEQEGETDGTLF
jgi:DNA modification methylase